MLSATTWQNASAPAVRSIGRLPQVVSACKVTKPIGRHVYGTAIQSTRLETDWVRVCVYAGCLYCSIWLIVTAIRKVFLSSPKNKTSLRPADNHFPSEEDAETCRSQRQLVSSSHSKEQRYSSLAGIVHSALKSRNCFPCL